MPNTPVDVNSWEVSACYPRGNFYPLSDGNSIFYRRITMPYFRICSTCRCRSQAPFCLYTLRMVSNHSEGTFERLRYSLGGDRPSQTVHQTLSACQDHCAALEFRITKGGIPRLAPPRLTPWLQSLPLILYIKFRNSMPNYSKALRGLSV